MLVLEDARDEVSLMVVLLLSVRRNWKLENLLRERELSIDVEARASRATGRGAESTGVSALEGRKQLNGMMLIYGFWAMCSCSVVSTIEGKAW